jgi:hypothetical protein
MATSQVTPGLVSDLPSIETLLADAGYEHRTTARPGLWGRQPYDEPGGARSFRTASLRSAMHWVWS